MEGDTGLELPMGKENGIPTGPMWVMRGPGSRGEGNGRQRGPQVQAERGCRGIRDPNMRLWMQRVSGST